jgi:hypothetical protein
MGIAPLIQDKVANAPKPCNGRPGEIAPSRPSFDNPTCVGGGREKRFSGAGRSQALLHEDSDASADRRTASGPGPNSNAPAQVNHAGAKSGAQMGCAGAEAAVFDATA